MNNSFLKKSLKLSAFVAILATTGCAEYHRRVLEHTEAKGTEFNRTIAKEYEALGSIEQHKMYDESSANYYYCKALYSKRGFTVLPTPLCRWDIEADKLPDLEKARARLMNALNRGARQVAPHTTAFAQAHFDCWVEQQAEGWQKSDIARCRTEFTKVIADVEHLLMGGDKAVLSSDKIFFSNNSSQLDDEAAKVIEKVAEIAKGKDAAEHILLIGRTDEAGDLKHNKNLSGHRAFAVKKELIRHGIDPHRIAVKAAGETAGPQVDAHNRRVDIIFLKN